MSCAKGKFRILERSQKPRSSVILNKVEDLQFVARSLLSSQSRHLFTLPLAGAGFHFFACTKKRNKEMHRKWWPYGFPMLVVYSAVLRNSLRSDSPRDYSAKYTTNISHSFLMRVIETTRLRHASVLKII